MQCRGEPFAESLEDGKFFVRITSPNTPGDNSLTLEPTGLEKVNEPIKVETESAVSRAFLADLDGDNAPELFVVLMNAGSGSYGEVLAWSSNGKKSLTPIVIEKPAEKDLTGYMGHDAFEVVEGTLIRRFPVYKEGDTNAKPTGGWRQIQYKLAPGEASWQLHVDHVDSF